MNIDEKNSSTKGYVRFRTLFDYVMGAFYLAMGLLMLFADKLGLRDAMGIKVEKPWLMALGILLVAYGLFRIYRGIKHIF